MKHWILLLALAAPGALAAAPQSEPRAAPELLVRLDPQTITVGDRVWASFEVTVDEGTPEPRFPPLGDTWGETEILSREPVVRENAGTGRVRYRQRFALTAFRPGPVRLPVVAVTVPTAGSEQVTTLSSPPDLTLGVDSVLPPLENDSSSVPPPSPRPPQPPRPLPIGAAFWWSLGGGLALLAAALLFVALRPRRPAVASFASAPALAPWPELLANLAQAGTAESPEAAHVALSFALRRYLGRGFGFPALESTNREIGRELDSRRVPAGAAAEVREILAACDRVKFARATPDAATVTARLAAARATAGGAARGRAPVNTLPHLAQPGWLLLLLLLPWLAWRHHRRPEAGLTYSRLPVGARRGLGLHAPFYLRLAALALLVVALARPQLGFAWEESQTEGIDIEIVLDVSTSMAAEDFQPKNRLVVAKKVIQDFIAGRPADRIGLVAFSGTALTRAPLTNDHAMLRFLVDSVGLDALPRGTAIGVALATAARRLESSTAKSRIVVLVTDGANNAGEIDPATAAALCRGLGLKVYTIGVGSAGNRPVPVPMAIREPSGRIVVKNQMAAMPVDEELLAAIATGTGGKFYRATDSEALVQVFAEIDRLEKTPLEVKRHVRYREAFMPFAWGALALLLAPLAPAALGRTVEP